MLERIIDYFLGQPRRLLELGRALLNSAGVLFIAGMVGYTAVTVATAVARSVSKGANTVVTLADVLPAIPTWWVPESGLGFGLAAALGLVGAVALQTGRAYERVLHH